MNEEKPGFESNAAENNAAPVSRLRKGLSAVFNRASLADSIISAAITGTFKVAVLACTASVAAPMIKLAVLSAACGLLTNYTRHVLNNRRAVKDGKEPVKYSFKKAAMGAGFGLLGGTIGYGLGHAWNHFFDPGCLDKVTEIKLPNQDQAILPPVAAPEPTLEPVIVTPVVEPPCSIVDALSDYVAHHDVSDTVKSAVERAQSADPRISAQGLKDIAMMRYNGVGGMEKNLEQAIELYKQSAALGNIQAKVDLAYIKFHGNMAAGIVADDTGLQEMKELSKHSKVASQLVEQWTNPTLPAPAVVPQPEIPSAPVEISVESPVATPDAAPVAPEPAPAPAPEITSSAEPNCMAEFSMDNDDVTIICPTDTSNTFNIGDRVRIERPPLLPLMQ